MKPVEESRREGDDEVGIIFTVCVGCKVKMQNHHVLVLFRKLQNEMTQSASPPATVPSIEILLLFLYFHMQ